METIGELHVKVTGIGRSRFGLWLMGVVARSFNIDLDIKVMTNNKYVYHKLHDALSYRDKQEDYDKK